MWIKADLILIPKATTKTSTKPTARKAGTIKKVTLVAHESLSFAAQAYCIYVFLPVG